jgi:hypothetical protein
MVSRCRLANRTKINQNNEEYNVRKFLYILILGFTPLGAFAQSILLMHGSECESNRYGDYDRLLTRDQFGISFGVPQNSGPTGTAMGQVRCQFTLPAMEQMTGFLLLVTAYDRHPNANIRCEIKAVDFEGNLVGEDYGNTKGRSSASKQFLSLVTFNSTDEKYVYVTCDIPQSYEGNKSHLTSLRLIVGGK